MNKSVAAVGEEKREDRADAAVAADDDDDDAGVEVALPAAPGSNDATEEAEETSTSAGEVNRDPACDILAPGEVNDSAWMAAVGEANDANDAGETPNLRSNSASNSSSLSERA